MDEELIPEPVRHENMSSPGGGKSTSWTAARHADFVKPSFDEVQVGGPHLWFRQARALQRKIIVHVGPTNSGKTYRAVQALKKAKSGVYASPLRLLAWQVSQELGCSLITGQEKHAVDGSSILSCTVEMTPVDDIVDVAIIDEVQLMGDKNRGWAFTRAVLGLPAREVHLCGEEGAVDLIRKICELTGDELEVNYYERLSPLRTEEEAMKSWEDVRPGDAVITFSRKDIHRIREKIEKMTKYKCAMIYGSLPPEIRKEQATAFNSPNSAQKILIATDAVGMGVNFSVKRIVFSKMEKFDGESTRQLTLREVKQIAGRAGRFGQTEEAVGLVTAMKDRDLEHIRMALPHPNPLIKEAYVFPPSDFLRTRFHNVCLDHLEPLRDEIMERLEIANFYELKELLQNGLEYEVDKRIKELLAKEEEDDSVPQRSLHNLQKLEVNMRKDVTRLLTDARRTMLRLQRVVSDKVAEAYNDALLDVMREVDDNGATRVKLARERKALLDRMDAAKSARDANFSGEEYERLVADASRAEKALEELESKLEGDYSGEFMYVQRTDEFVAIIKALRGIPLNVDYLLQVAKAPVNMESEVMSSHMKQYARKTHSKSIRELVESLDDPFLLDYLSVLYEVEDVEIAEDVHVGPPLILDRLPSSTEPSFEGLRPRNIEAYGTGKVDMYNYEQLYNAIDLSLWLAHRFDHPPKHIQRLGQLKHQCLARMHRFLGTPGERQEEFSDEVFMVDGSPMRLSKKEQQQLDRELAASFKEKEKSRRKSPRTPPPGRKKTQSPKRRSKPITPET